jgi:hypothetical protein
LITRWAGPCSLPLDFWARWMAFGPFSHVWSTMDHQCCWALGLWWITGVLDLVRGGLEKIGLYTDKKKYGTSGGWLVFKVIHMA